jgi:asparagine synthase (glutamine-hydrolysing)
MRRADLGVYRKGTLAGWGLDLRSPTADRRLAEFCLSLPIEQMLKDGVARPLARRALADRLPSQVLNEPRRGHQGVDWHEGLTAARPQIDAELRRLEDCGPEAKLINLERLRDLAAKFPNSGWESADVQIAYRVVLQRGLAAAHFIRSALSGVR